MNALNPSRNLQRPQHSSKFPAFQTARGVRCATRPSLKVVLRAAAGVQELEEIDPRTGQVLVPTAVTAPIASEMLTAGGLTWAYRKNTPREEAVTADKKPLLMLHGLGSLSYSYRNTLSLLATDGFQAYAPDWIGHGDSDKPASSSSFDYSEAAYIRALDAYITTLGIQQPFVLVVQGYVLSQYALLWAQRNPEKVDKILLLNTPVSLKSKLRPELAAYKNPLPFLRPKAGKAFDGLGFAIGGSAYMMERRDANVYQRSYVEFPAATEAVASTMERVDFGALCKEVDEGFRTWRKPAALLFGSADPFVPTTSVFDFLESKRTNMIALTAPAKLGHMPQEDYAEALQSVIIKFLAGSEDTWSASNTSKMTKRGVVG